MDKVDRATKTSLKIGDTEKEEIAKEKVNKIKAIELILATCVQYNQSNTIMFKDKLKDRELYLRDLESFCDRNRLNFNEFYVMEKKERKIAV
jgi:hypothetical protein